MKYIWSSDLLEKLVTNIYNMRIFTLLLFITLLSCATAKMGKDALLEDLSFEKIIEAPGTKADLYIKANEWFVNTFNSAESVIQFHDKEAGKIMGKYVAPFNISIYNYYSQSTITVEVKDNKAKISFSDPLWKTVSDSFGNSYNEQYKPVKKDNAVKPIRQTWIDVSQSFESHMLLKSSEW